MNWNRSNLTESIQIKRCFQLSVWVINYWYSTAMMESYHIEEWMTNTGTLRKTLTTSWTLTKLECHLHLRLKYHKRHNALYTDNCSIEGIIHLIDTALGEAERCCFTLVFIRSEPPSWLLYFFHKINDLLCLMLLWLC